MQRTHLTIRLHLILATAVMHSIAAEPAQAGEKASGDVFVEHRLILEEQNGGTDSSVSPDGKWLAYSSRKSGNLDVWIAEIDTGNTRQITTDPATDNEPRWHPDGTQLCFVTQRSGSQDVYVVDLETGKETPIATKPFNEDYPSFSKDGSQICFTGGPRGFREVQVYDFETDKIRTLTRGYGYVGSTNFSPDGQLIIFHAYYDNSYNSGKSDVFVVPARGGRPKNVTKERATWDYKPNWSFDGEWITYSSRRTTPNFNLWLMRPDGSEKMAMTDVRERDLRWSNWTKDGRVGWHQINPQTGRLRAADIASGDVTDLHISDFNIRELSASPDGESLLYETDAQIHVVGAQPAAEPRRITIGLEPRWSRDGETISYLRHFRTKVGIVPAAGGEPKLLELKPSAWPKAATNAWSPDGQTLAVVTRQDERSVLTLLSLDGTQTPLHESSDPIRSPVWSTDGKRVFFTENHPPSVGYYISDEPVVKAVKQAAANRPPVSHIAAADEDIRRLSVPDFELARLDGERVGLSDVEAPVTLLYFWSKYRECEADLQVLQRLHEKYSGRGVRILSLCYSSGTREQVQDFLEAADVNIPTLMCTQQVCDEYDVATFPTSYLLNAGGEVHYWMYGILVADHWDELISELLESQSASAAGS